MTMLARALGSWAWGRTSWSLLVAAGIVALPVVAQAQVVPCDPTTYMCSMGQAGALLESTDPLPVGIDSGWVPSCATGTHCTDEKIQVRTHLSIEPLLNDVPIYSVDTQQSASVQISWPDTNNFVVELTPTATNDAVFEVSHGLVPSFELYLDFSSWGFGKHEVRLDAADLVNLIPGAQFNYTATASTNFSPWGFPPPATVNVAGTDLANSRLFSVTFEQLHNVLSTQGLTDVVNGVFSFNATSNIDFEYETTAVRAVGGTPPIDAPDGTALYPISDGDFLELQVVTEGIVRYSGTVSLKPVISITEVAGIGINLDFPIDVGLDFPVSSADIPVTFPARTVHLPLPNVFVPSSVVDFGPVQTGNASEQVVTIENTGETGALLEFESSDPQFAPLVASALMGPQSLYDLRIRFRPSQSGRQQATITVRSNDPDTPEQSFAVFGDGDVGAGGNGGGGGTGAAGAGGITAAGGSAGSPVGGTAGTGGSSTDAGTDGGSAGSAAGICSPGDTRTCVGPGACSGGQICESSGQWGPCDCRSVEDEGGCGCRTTGNGSSAILWLSALGLALLARCRRARERRD